MNKYERLREKLLARKKVLGTNMTVINSPLMVEKMNRDDLDFILFDAEHGVYNNENMIPSLQVCRLIGLPSFVRVPNYEYHLIARAIDLGADGIMLPRTETAEQVADAVNAMRFAPVGKTGCGGHVQFRDGESFEEYQKGRFLFIQIESQKGIDNLPEMLERYGDEIAAVIIGPYDMSIMLGTPRDIGSAVMKKAIRRVFDISAEANKSCGIFCDDEIVARTYLEMGANVFWACTDNVLFLRGFNQVFDALSEME